MSTATAYALYLVFTLGGAAVYFMLPQGQRVRWGVAAVFGMSALGMLFALLATRVVAPDGTSGYFYLFSTVALASAVRVVTHTKPVYSALYFILVVIAVAALMVLQQAEFLAIALIIIYAGAILVTYLFVIMLAQQPGVPIYDRRAREPFAAVLAGFVLMAAIAGKAGELPKATAGRPQPRLTADTAPSTTEHQRTIGAGNTLAVGEVVMTKHVVTLQLAGVLLLISMVGAIALSRRRVRSEVVSVPRPPLGQIGREVKPF